MYPSIQALSRGIYIHIHRQMAQKSTFVFSGAENVEVCLNIETCRFTDRQHYVKPL